MDKDFISNSVSRMRKKLKQSEDKDDTRLKEIQDTLDILLAKFRSEALSTHSAKKFDVTGFTNLVKLQLLISGNPTEIVENKLENVELDEKIEEIIDSGKFDEFIDVLSQTMNEENEAKGKPKDKDKSK